MLPRRLTVALALLLVSTLLAPAASAAGVTRFVNNGVTCDNDTSNSTVTPYCEIQEALDDSSDGDIIEVAAGTYTESSGVFVVDNFDVDITINGAGEGVTILDGQNARGGIRISGHDAIITGLSVINASATGSGAGITIQNPDILVPRPELTLTDVTVADGAATYSAAGILAFNNTVAELTRVTVSGNDVNKSVQVGAGAGGGMGIGSNTTVTITDSVFTGNTADTNGGAIDIGGNATVGMSGTRFDGNHADENGGAVYNSSSGTDLVITNSTFDTNTAGTAGGAIYFNAGDTLNVSGSYFTANVATAGPGGAIEDTTASAAAIANSTFFDNTAGDNGGAIRTSGVIANATIVANDADNGGGIATNGFTNPKIRNTILYDNTASTTGPDCNFAVSQGYNLIGDTTGCSISGDTTGNVTGQDPMLTAAADNSGPTFTMAIASNSPARDAGNPLTPGVGDFACESTDQRGFLRDDVRCDIGAFEFGAAPQVLRYFGSNRYATAADVSENDFPDTVVEVFVATGFNYPDALAGAAVAGKVGAPLLLVDSGVPAAAAAELTRLDPDVITILGGTGAVSGAVETDLGGYAPTVERVFGTNRYRTAVEISQHGFPTDGSADVVYVATGLGFADALAAGPAAAAGNGPVLLVPGTSLPQEVADEIVRLTPDRIVVVGGTAVISDTVLTALDALQVGDTVERIAGNNRYTTAVAISQDAFPGGADRAYVATGLNFPDALAGAAAAGAYGAPVLLVPGTSIPAEVSTEITRLGATTVIILGGTAVVSTGVENDLKTLIGAS